MVVLPGDDESRTATEQPRYEISLPREIDGCDQDEEFCEVRIDGERRRIRFHDYDEIYSIPGLYEQLFYDLLRCDSPRVVCELLSEQVEEAGLDVEDLSVLDLGGGNGMVAEQLAELGVDAIVGVDLIEEAAEAARRDRPGVYDEYVVADLTAMPDDARETLEERHLNCLMTVAALGFGDIPPEVFIEADRMIEPDGWVAFNIKEDFISDADRSGFAGLISRALDAGTLELQAQRRYQHRLSVAGEPLHYLAIVARRRGELAELGA